jgi:hypothetical protein
VEPDLAQDPRPSPQEETAGESEDEEAEKDQRSELAPARRSAESQHERRERRKGDDGTLESVFHPSLPSVT